MTETLSELRFLVEHFDKFGAADLKMPSAKTSDRLSAGTITAHRNTGTVQTPARAIAPVAVNAALIPQLVGALERLATEVSQSKEMSDEDREQTADTIRDLIAAASAPKQNGPKLRGYSAHWTPP